jgi:DNA-binding IclR family transcriptional regulator
VTERRAASSETSEGSSTRVLDILEFLARRSTPSPAAMIAMSCDIPRSSLYTVLKALRERRFVLYHAGERTWSLGPAAHELSAAAPLFAHGLAVLRAFASASGSLTPRQIAAHEDLPMAVVDRVLPLLEESDLLHAEPDGTYALGLELVSLASRVAAVDALRIAAHVHLVQLRDATHETASLIIRDGDHALYVDQVESRHVLRISSWVGRRIPLEDTATGAAFADTSTSHLVRDAVEPGVTSIACALDIPRHDAAISLLAPGWRIREFGEERARQIVEAVARKLAMSANR